MKKNLAVLLVLSLIVTMLPANTLFAQTLDTNVVFTPFSVETTTPPAIMTTPAAISFNFQTNGFREVDRVNFNATHNFSVRVRVNTEHVDSDVAAVEAFWMHEGELWQGRGGDSFQYWSASDFGMNSERDVTLQLEGRQGQRERGGNWTLIVALIGYDNEILAANETRIAVLNVFNEPYETPTPSPTPGQNDQGEDDDNQGGSTVIVIVVPPPIVVVNRSVTTIVITHQINTIVSRNVQNPKVRIVVRVGSGIKVSGQTIVKVREVNAGLTIVNNVRITNRSVVRNNVVVNISNRVINTWTITDSSEVTISFRNACRRTFDQRFSKKRRSSRRLTSITVVNRMLVTNLFEINIRIDNVPVVFPGGPGSDESIEENDSYMTMNINDLDLTEAQLRRLGMLFFYLQDLEDLESLSYRIVRVYVNDEYINIPILGDGWFGLIVLPDDMNFDGEEDEVDEDYVDEDEVDEDEVDEDYVDEDEVDEDYVDEDEVDEDYVDEDEVDEDYVDEDEVDEDYVDEDEVDEDYVDEDEVDEDYVDEDEVDEDVVDDVVVNNNEDDDDQGEDNDDQ